MGVKDFLMPVLFI